MISAFQELPLLRNVTFLLLALVLINALLTAVVILLGFYHAKEKRRADDLEDQLNRGLNDTLHQELPIPGAGRANRGKL